MKEDDKKTGNKSDRRNFLKLGLLASGAAALAGTGLKALADDDKTGKKVKLMTTDGKVVEVDSGMVEEIAKCGVPVTNEEAREGIAGKKFVMVIDLAKCKHALKCQDSCNKNHYITGKNAWLKVYNMEENKETAPYWMPTICQHCDNPPCVKVCPVDATFKRRDGIVLIDNERCIGCRFCMAACPYSARVFNWEEPNQGAAMAKHTEDNMYSPEYAGVPSIKGTVDKCDFCPHMIREGKMPHCVSACPNDVFMFGDKYEDTVTNGSGQSFRLSELLKKNSGYRLMEELGTAPSVYYLPPKDRLVEYEKGLENYDEFKSTDNTEES
tara:strand:- start:10288 stop:11262 length:975 start_codon:yes stop_codon:yes gene_type:complete